MIAVAYSSNEYPGHSGVEHRLECACLRSEAGYDTAAQVVQRKAGDGSIGLYMQTVVAGIEACACTGGLLDGGSGARLLYIGSTAGEYLVQRGHVLFVPLDFHGRNQLHFVGIDDGAERVEVTRFYPFAAVVDVDGGELVPVVERRIVVNLDRLDVEVLDETVLDVSGCGGMVAGREVTVGEGGNLFAVLVGGLALFGGHLALELGYLQPVAAGIAAYHEAYVAG